MPQNNIKFTFENLQNIIRNGNQQLIDYQNKEYTIKNFKPKIKNKLQTDQNGHLYIQKDGKKQYRLSKQKYGIMPNFCPECHRLMGKKQYDSFFWGVHKRCYDCSMKLQREMEREGTYNQFAINYMKDKLVTTCNDAINFYNQTKKYSSRQILLNDQGDMEQWGVQDEQSFNEAVNKVIKQIQKYRDEAIIYFQEKLMNAKREKT